MNALYDALKALFVAVFALLLFYACASTGTSDNAVVKTATTVFEGINEGAPPLSIKTDRFFPDNVQTVYVAMFVNDTPLRGLEDAITRETRNAVPIISEMQLVNTLREADLVVSGRITTNSLRVITRSRLNEPDFCRERIIVSVSLYDKQNNARYTNSAQHCVYFTRVTDPTLLENIENDYATNIAAFIAEIVAYGYQRTLMRYDETNSVRLEEGTTFFQTATNAQTNGQTIYQTNAF